MAIEPPKNDTPSRGIPGIVIPLIFLSVILLGAVLVFGALAFDVNIPGRGDDDTAVASPDTAVESSGFTVRERRAEGATTIVEVEVSVINTAADTVGPFQVLVQCDDDGYVSAIADVDGLEAGEDRTIAMELSGRGNPACHAPVIDIEAPGAGVREPVAAVARAARSA